MIWEMEQQGQLGCVVGAAVSCTGPASITAGRQLGVLHLLVPTALRLPSFSCCSCVGRVTCQLDEEHPGRQSAMAQHNPLGPPWRGMQCL